MRWPDPDVVVELEERAEEAVVELAGELLGAADAVEVWSAGVADEEGVAGEREPRLVRTAPKVRAEQRHAVRRVAGGVKDSQRGVAKRDDVAVVDDGVLVGDVGR